MKGRNGWTAVLLALALVLTTAAGSAPLGAYAAETQEGTATGLTESATGETAGGTDDPTTEGTEGSTSGDEEEPDKNENVPACTATEGCTLAEGHEGDCVLQKEEQDGGSMEGGAEDNVEDGAVGGTEGNTGDGSGEDGKTAGMPAAGDPGEGAEAGKLQGAVPAAAKLSGDAGELQPAYDWYTDAEGTEYTISTVEDLMGFAKITQGKAEGINNNTADLFEGKTVKLANHLDLSEIPLYSTKYTGDEISYCIAAFYGTFDGQGNTISNLIFKGGDGAEPWGLFFDISGTVQNLTLDGVKAEGLGNDDRFGALAYRLKGNAQNCHVKNVTVTGSSAGDDKEIGIGGIFSTVSPTTQAQMKACTVSGINAEIEGLLKWSGGLVGAVNGGTVIDNCQATEIVFSATNMNQVGGLIGDTQNGAEDKGIQISGSTAENIRITGDITVQLSGGFAGSVKDYTESSGCTVKQVEITSQGDMQQVGGFSGASSPNNSYQTCTVKQVEITSQGDMSSVGGFSGSSGLNNSYQTCAVSDVEITSQGDMENGGGFSGYANSSANFEDCSVNGIKITSHGAMSYTGGFSGFNNKGVTYESCRADQVNITSTNPEGNIYQIGGFSANTQNGTAQWNTFNDCHVTGLEMKLTGVTNAGDRGVAGFAASLANYTKATDCSVQGSIDTTGIKDAQTGGFLANLGWNGITIEVLRCKADVDIKANGSAGGFVGSSAMDQYASVRDVSAVFTDCEATGDVMSTEGAAGGFVGDGNRGTYTGCTAMGDVSGVVSGGFWGKVTPNPNPNVTDEIKVSGCEANGRVEGSEYAGGFVGNAVTTDGNNTTSLTVKDSTASPIVTGSTENTVTGGFINGKENDPNITQQDNTPSAIVVGGSETDLFVGDVTLAEALAAEVEYTGEGAAPIRDLTKLRAAGITAFTVRFTDENSTQNRILENKPAGELTEEALKAIAPTEPGTYTMLVSGQGEGAYALLSADFSIVKGTPVGSPAFAQAESAVLLSEVKLSGNMKNKAGIEVAGTFAWEDGGQTVEQGKAYTWKFTPDNTDCYKTVTGTVIVWPEKVPGGDTNPDTGEDKGDDGDNDNDSGNSGHHSGGSGSSGSSNTSKPANVKAAKTGDSANPALYMGILLAAVIGIGGVWYYRRRNARKEK